MKSYKFFIESTNNHNKFVDLLQDTIKKDNKVINGFNFNYDFTGLFEWSDKYYIVLATPYWDGNENLPINIYTDKFDDIPDQSFKLPKLKNINDVNSTIKFYYEKIDEITSSLNKRTKLRKDLEIILKSIEAVNIEEYTFQQNNLWSSEIDKISDNDIDKILDIINKKYSHLLLSNKYNI